MSISTRKGDHGETDLLFGCRVRKDDPRMMAIGDVDELNAALGLLRVTAAHAVVQREVPLIQKTLIQLMGELAMPMLEDGQGSQRGLKIRLEESAVQELDVLVNELEKHGALDIKDWAIPGAGGVLSAAHADLARTICRRAERSIVGLQNMIKHSQSEIILRYMNRLSDVLWLMARMEEKRG